MSEYTPITGELRAAMHPWGWVESDGSITFTSASMPPSIDAEQSLAISGSDFDCMCDAIDSIHAGLERENARLKAELDEAEHRGWTRGYDEGFASADDWLGQHEDAMAEHGWVKMPKDAGGEYIHVGDKVTCARSVWQVTGLRLTGLAWGVCCTIFNDHGGSSTNVYPPCDLRHYHAPTVEDVLREFAYGLGVPVADSYVAAAAAKLRLAGDAE